MPYYNPATLDSGGNGGMHKPNYQTYETAGESEESNAVVAEDISKRDVKSTLLYLLAAGILIIVCTVIYATNNNPLRISSVGIRTAKAITDATTQNSKPNFIFLLADDLSWNSMGYMEYDLTFTSPTMTAMARDGVIMSNFYAQEICTPSRAALMTGRYPSTIGMQYHEILANYEWGLNIDETTIADVLKTHGYTNYMLGKWNLGHYTADYLPTARGFDQFVGYLGAQTYYWSKHGQENDKTIYDFILSDTSCYDLYNYKDRPTYSTMLYEKKAVNVIRNHNFKKSPMFMYFSAQAVHNPFDDVSYPQYENGIPMNYVGESMYTAVAAQITGSKRKQYALSLYILDQAVNSMRHALEDVGQEQNTYFIFASDNGGCADAGGANSPLRGTKGSLFEGGVKTNSFIYSPGEKLMSSQSRGTTYSGLMHMTDWFPTILDLAGIKYTAPSGYELDGVSHVKAWDTNIAAREFLVVNMYAGVAATDGTTYSCANANCAVRDSRYKLLHVYDGGISTNYYDYHTTADNDDAIGRTDPCTNTAAMNEGEFKYLLYDMEKDPFETTDLYNNPAYAAIKNSLELKMAEHESKVARVGTIPINPKAFDFMLNHGNFVQPFKHTKPLSFVENDKATKNSKSTSLQVCRDGAVPATYFTPGVDDFNIV